MTSAIRKGKRILPFALWLLPAAALAEIPPIPVVATGPVDFIRSICKIENWLFAILVVFSVMVILWGGWKFMSSGGNEAKVSEARKFVIYGLVGVSVAILSKALLSVTVSLVAPTYDISQIWNLAPNQCGGI